MNTLSTILTYTLPFVVVGYIVWDLLISYKKVSKYTVESAERTKSKIEKRGFESPRGGNGGKFFSQMEILDNAKTIITKMF